MLRCVVERLMFILYSFLVGMQQGAVLTNTMTRCSWDVQYIVERFGLFWNTLCLQFIPSSSACISAPAYRILRRDACGMFGTLWNKYVCCEFYYVCFLIIRRRQA